MLEKTTHNLDFLEVVPHHIKVVQLTEINCYKVADFINKYRNSETVIVQREYKRLFIDNGEYGWATIPFGYWVADNGRAYSEHEVAQKFNMGTQEILPTNSGGIMNKEERLPRVIVYGVQDIFSLRFVKAEIKQAFKLFGITDGVEFVFPWVDEKTPEFPTCLLCVSARENEFSRYFDDTGFGFKYKETKFIPNWEENGRHAINMRDEEITHYSDYIIAFREFQGGYTHCVLADKMQSLNKGIHRVDVEIDRWGEVGR